MSDLVITHLDGASATLTLNQPAKRNPISPAMRAALIGSLELLRKNDAIRSVILTGAGDVFCSGLDLGEFGGESFEDDLADSKSIRDFYEYLISFPKPLIAAVNGPAVAGGAGVALVCDVTILAETASICFSEVRLGFIPAIVGVYLQLSIGVKKAREVMLSARSVSAHESLSIGVVNGVVPSGTLLEECRHWAAQFAKNSPQALASTKKMLAEQLRHKALYDMNLAVEMNAQARQSSECKAGVGAFLRKEKPPWSYH